ncbi:MAG: hypothetical protein ABW128_06915 [Rhizorhabdus sp.]
MIRPEIREDKCARDCAAIVGAGLVSAAFGAGVGLLGIPDPYATLLMIIFAAAFVAVIWSRCR